jgi:hypothetical protein
MTFGIFDIDMYYQLIRRLRDHNARRQDVLDAANAYAWRLRAGEASELQAAMDSA